MINEKEIRLPEKVTNIVYVTCDQVVYTDYLHPIGYQSVTKPGTDEASTTGYNSGLLHLKRLPHNTPAD